MRATRTYLELKEPTQFKDAFGTFPDITIARVPQPSPDLYRTCYRTVGEAFHWFDRWEWSDDEITTHVADPAIQLFVATRRTAKLPDDLAVSYELRRLAEDHSVEFASFVIVTCEIGQWCC